MQYIEKRLNIYIYINDRKELGKGEDKGKKYISEEMKIKIWEKNK